MDTMTLKAAERNLTYPVATLDRDERARLLSEYHAAQNAMVAEWKVWLADEYADDLPEAVQDRIFGKAWEDGHSGGYDEIEFHYIPLAVFARDVRKA